MPEPNRTTETGPEANETTETGPEPSKTTETGPEPSKTTETGPEPSKTTETGPEPKKTTETGPEPEHQSRKNIWMVRPCEIYKEEYDDCRSIRARFHQYFVFGKTIDCTQWKEDYKNCYLWDKYKSDTAYDKLITSEKKHRMERLQGHYRNNVWEKRDKPPENWNAPLPEWLATKYENTYLKYMSDDLKAESEGKTKSYCTIM